MDTGDVFLKVEVDLEDVAADHAEDGPENAASEVPGGGADDRRAEWIGTAEQANGDQRRDCCRDGSVGPVGQRRPKGAEAQRILIGIGEADDGGARFRREPAQARRQVFGVVSVP